MPPTIGATAIPPEIPASASAIAASSPSPEDEGAEDSLADGQVSAAIPPYKYEPTPEAGSPYSTF